MKLLLALVLLVACSTRSRVRNPFFYRATKAGKTIYVLGTMHVGFTLGDFHPLVQEKLRRAELVAVEANDELMKKATLERFNRFQEFAKSEMLVPYPLLKEKVSPKAWKEMMFTLSKDEVKTILERRKVTRPVTELHPTLVEKIVLDLVNAGHFDAFSEDVKFRMGKRDLLWVYFDKFNKIDAEIVKVARAQKTPVISLDVLDQDLLKLLTDFERDSLTFIEIVFGDSEAFLRQYRALRAEYQRGSRSGIAHIVESAEFKQGNDIVSRRNAAWAQTLDERREKFIFAAVGAGHLIGEDNLLQRLRASGFEIEDALPVSP